MNNVENSSVYIIAEAGVNHNGNLDMAKKLIYVAANAGADAVKFQTFKAEKVISKMAPKAEYQKTTTNNTESQFDMVKKLELDTNAHQALFSYCNSLGVQFLSTPFDFESIDLLAKTMDLPCIKIPSGEITNGPYLLHVARTGKPVIVSTGMTTLDEIETALGVLAFGYMFPTEQPSLNKFQDAFRSDRAKEVLKGNVTLLHCTTEYPAPYKEVNLRAMETMRAAFKLPVGLSDHTRGIAVPIAAAALGACIIEKHFTLDRNLPGPDHKASLEPDDLKSMVTAIRQVEEALGAGRKEPTFSELKNRDIARRSLVAAKKIKKGERFSAENLTIKRPGIGVSPMRYWEFIGRNSTVNYDFDEMISGR